MIVEIREIMNRQIYNLLFIIIAIIGINPTIAELNIFEMDNDFYQSCFPQQKLHRFTMKMPMQTGVGKRSKPIKNYGLYKVPTENGKRVYNAGKVIDPMTIDEQPYIFARRLNDFYTNNNFFWFGSFFIYPNAEQEIPFASEQNGWIKYDGYDGYIKDGVFYRILRYHYDRIITNHQGLTKGVENGPLWYNQNIEAALDINLPQLFNNIDRDKPAKLVVSILDYNNKPGTSLTIDAQINNSDESKTARLSYTGSGAKYWSFDVSSTLFDVKPDEHNVVRFSTGKSFFLDFVEIHVPILINENNEIDLQNMIDEQVTLILPTTGNGGSTAFPNPVPIPDKTKFLLKVDGIFNGSFRFKNVKYVADVTKMGKENLEYDNDTLTPLLFDLYINCGVDEEKTLFLTNILETMEFDATEKTLEAIDLKAIDYLAIAPENTNYFSCFDAEKEITAYNFDNAFTANLFARWKNYSAVGSSGKTMNSILTTQGFKPTVVKLEDVIDIYGCGIFSPYPINKVLTENPQIKNVTLIGMTTIDYKNQDPEKFVTNPNIASSKKSKLYVPFSGIPTGLFYSENTGSNTTDHIYMVDHAEKVNDLFNEMKRTVGRILVYTNDEIEKWITKRMHFTLGDTAILVAGEGNVPNFSDHQRELQGIISTTLLDMKTDMGEKKKYANITAFKQAHRDISRNINFTIYQGHGQVSYLNSAINKFLPTTDEYLADISNHIWATCYAGDFVYNGALKTSISPVNGTRNNLSYTYTNGKYMSDVGGVYGDARNLLQTSADATKGALNIITSNGLAIAEWEHVFVTNFIKSLPRNSKISWGDAFIQSKRNSSHDETLFMYHLFGDPGLQVLKDNPRKVISDTIRWTNQYYDITLKGDWAANSTLTLKPSKTMLNTEINTGTFNSAQIVNGKLFKRDLKKDSSGDYLLEYIKSETFSTTSYDIYFGKSNIFGLDKSSPSFLTSRYFQSKKYLRISVSAQDNHSGVAGFRYHLQSAKGTHVLNSGENLIKGDDGALSNYTFKITDKMQLYMAENPTEKWFFNCDVQDNVGLIKRLSSLNSNKGIEVLFAECDINLNGINDLDEMTFFNSSDFSDGLQDSNGNGLSDADDIANGNHPYEFILELKAGWNLLAIPCEINSEMKTEIKSIADGDIYTYNSTEEYYEVEENYEFTTNEGFWIFCEFDKDPIIINGFPGKNELEMQPGWNIFGVLMPVENQKIIRDNDAVFIRNKSDYRLLKDRDILQPLEGYWYKNARKVSHTIYRKQYN